MDEVKLARLVPGLQVCDVQGTKIGTLSHVHQFATDDATPTPAFADKVIEVKTGLLGLGKHLYIPTQAIEMVTDDNIVLNRPRAEVEAADWTTKPEQLRQVS